MPNKKDKSGKQKWRVVIDYRKLNEVTVDDLIPIPNIENILEKLGKANYFSTIDLAKGLHQVLVDENDQKLHSLRLLGTASMFVCLLV